MDSPYPNTPVVPRILDTQVGGHAGVLENEDGSLIIKPALPLELKFYQALLTDPALASLHPFTPRFLGTLKLEGQLDESVKDPPAGIAVTPVEGAQKESIVLSNLSFGFLKPNILDVKLGTVLYDETASPEKVERMLKTAKATTSLETGVRLTGFQVYDNNTSLPVNTPKSYGKSIKPSDLPDGIARFFPVGTSAPAEIPATPEIPSSNPVLITPATAHPTNSGLPRRTLLPLLRAICSDVAEIREVYASLEIRMVGGSLLIVYEGDWARAEEGIGKLGMVIDDDEDGGYDEEEGEDDDNDDDEEQLPYVIKLIDFAHTRLVPGEGPDKGVLKGLDTVISLLEGRIKDLESADQS
ncbi:hypothetical protein BDZ94DRAFT_1290953 [Collybia nuda]|uniref:Kinase n=1 Tax=Collybia nuda TaxID=64659 RepID=A0A9P5Y237_9AGAR|nr:hypothetical protein BDZ94DRAFT_1290953 [Collybia nuda]